MSELESVNIVADICDGIKCNTEYSDLNDAVNLAHEAQIDLQLDGCSNGLCPINWKPQRGNAA
ncbi:hypothetical protein BH10CYA1_BH10CYA1_35510 [soil metagenome]